MEVKKSREADLEQQRTTSFLLGVILVLAVLFVALEWNSDDSAWHFFEEEDNTLEAEMELAPLHREDNEIPMSLPNKHQEEVRSEEVRVVENDVELPPQVEPAEAEPIEQKEVVEQDETKPEAVDMYDEPVDFRVVEDLPQFPGGAVAFMKWLTKNLKYPPLARERKIQGQVIAEFIVNKDGSISDLSLVKSLDTFCDREAMRVLRMMPKWQAGIMDAKPCRTKVRIPIVFRL